MSTGSAGNSANSADNDDRYRAFSRPSSRPIFSIICTSCATKMLI